MGNSESRPGLTEELVEEYSTLTYLSIAEISNLLKKFYSIDPEKLRADFHHRFHRNEVLSKFAVIKNNPFEDRIFRVFSSEKDDCFSFEDMLDLCSVMSSKCPSEVKAAWAFKIFDFDEDGEITESDVIDILDRLTGDYKKTINNLDDELKMKIAGMLFKELNLHTIGCIRSKGFQDIMSRIPDFVTSFYFTI